MKPVAQYPMLIATLGIMLFSMMDAVMKGQALAMGTYNAMFWRMAMGALIVAVLYLPTRPVPASGRTLKIHLIRAALTAVMAYLFFFGLTRIPLAQAIGLSFIAPIITLFLAVPILGERIGANAKLAAVLGFGGVMVVVGGELLAVDQGSDAMGMVAVLLSAVMYAFNLVLQRMQALVARPLEIAFYQNTIVFLMLLVGLPFAVSWPESSYQWAGAALAAGLAVGVAKLADRQALASLVGKAARGQLDPPSAPTPIAAAILPKDPDGDVDPFGQRRGAHIRGGCAGYVARTGHENDPDTMLCAACGRPHPARARWP